MKDLLCLECHDIAVSKQFRGIISRLVSKCVSLSLSNDRLPIIRDCGSVQLASSDGKSRSRNALFLVAKFRISRTLVALSFRIRSHSVSRGFKYLSLLLTILRSMCALERKVSADTERRRGLRKEVVRRREEKQGKDKERTRTSEMEDEEGMRERGEKSGPNYYKLRGLWQAISLGLQFHVDTRNRQEDGALAEDNDGRTVN